MDEWREGGREGVSERDGWMNGEREVGRDCWMNGEGGREGGR